MKIALTFAASIFCLCSTAQTAQPWANWWLGMAYNAWAGRYYLGVTNAQDGILPGLNITFTTNAAGKIVIASTGGGGGSSNLPNFSATWPLTVTTNAILIQYGMDTNGFATTNLVGVTSNALFAAIPSTNGFVSQAEIDAATNTTSELWSAATNLIQGVTSNALFNATPTTNGFVSQAQIDSATNTTSELWSASTNLIQGVTSNGLYALIGSGPGGAIGLKTNIFTTNLTSQVHSNAFVLDSNGRIILGTNGFNTALSAPVPTHSTIPKLSVYGNIAVAGELKLRPWLWTQSTNFYQSPNGCLVISNIDYGGTAQAMYGSLAVVNSGSRQTAAVIKSGASHYSYGVDLQDNGGNNFFLYDRTASKPAFVVDASQRFWVTNSGSMYNNIYLKTHSAKQAAYAVANSACYYTFGVDVGDAGGHNFFLYDQGGSALAFISDASQRFGIRTNNPAYELDVRGDANVTGVYRAGSTAGLTTNIFVLTNGTDGVTLKFKAGILIGVQP